jgi:hypothetical protein
MLTRYKGQLKLKVGAFAIVPKEQRCAKRKSLWLAALGSSCTRCCETGQSSSRPKPATRQEAESSSQEEDALGREQTMARIL